MGRLGATILFFFIAFSYSKAEWIEITPLRQPKDNSTLADVESHTKDFYMIAGRRIVYKNPSDLTNSCHEQIHKVNSDIRTQNKVDCGFYFLKNNALIIKEHPKITLSNVAAAVPKENRGSVYPLYLVKQAKYWNNQPLYVFDECVAYLHGTATALETSNEIRAKTSFDHCIQLYYYGKICQKIAVKANYEYENDLKVLVGVLYIRIRSLADHMEKLGFLNDDHRKWLELL